MPPSHADDNQLQQAVTLFNEYLYERRHGSDVTFDQLRANYPDLADSLSALWEAYELGQSVASSRSFHDMLRDRFPNATGVTVRLTDSGLSLPTPRSAAAEAATMDTPGPVSPSDVTADLPGGEDPGGDVSPSDVTADLPGGGASSPGGEPGVTLDVAESSGASGSSADVTADLPADFSPPPVPEATGQPTLTESPGNPASLSIASELTRRFGDASPAIPGAEVGRYVREDEVARGGMGVILRVRDRDLRRTLAMKVMPVKGVPASTDPLGSRNFARFLEEAQVTAQLDHPGIVPVHEIGVDEDDRIYFTMRLVQGRELGEIFKLANAEQDGWNPPRAIGVMVKVCQAVAYAHNKGVVHRDLKPANVMVGRFGEVYVMDWGLAKVVGQNDIHDLRIQSASSGNGRSMTDSGLVIGSNVPLVTMDGDVIGTPAYMPPEQAMGRISEIDEKSDVYSLGAILYTLLTGQAPYVPPDGRIHPRVVLDNVIERPPVCVHDLNPRVPADLTAICEKAMARDKDARYPSSQALAEDLQAHLDHRVVRAYHTGALAEFKSWVVRNKQTAFAAVAIFFVLILGLVAIVLTQRSAQQALEKKNEQIIAANLKVTEQATLAQNRLFQVLRLADIKRLGEYTASAEELWPCLPEKVPEIERWLENANALVGHLPAHQETLAALRAQALPYDEEQKAADAASHPDADRLAGLRGDRETLQQELTTLRDAAGGAGPKATLLSYGPDESKKPLAYYFRHKFSVGDVDVQQLGVRFRVDDGAVIYLNGREAVRIRMPDGAVAHDTPAAATVRQITTESVTIPASLLVAGQPNVVAVEVHQADSTSSDLRFALELSAGTTKLIPGAATWRYHDVGGTVATAWQQVEFDDASWLQGPAPLGYGFSEGHGRLLELPSIIARYDAEIAAYEVRVGERRTWRFAETELQWQHDNVAGLVKGLQDFAAEGGPIASVTERLKFATSVRKLTIEDRAADWAAAVASIANSSECPAYNGLKITPQVGFVPVGRDPESKLWEFAHLQSGEIPVRGAGGKLVLNEKSALVFVLVPAGTFKMGAKRATLGVQSADTPSGLRITEVVPRSLAAEMGLRVGDRIVKVNEEEIKSRADFQKVFKALRSGASVAVELLRGDSRRRVESQLGSNIDPYADTNEGPVHEVALAAFLISKFEMTQGQWLRMAGRNPSVYPPPRTLGGKAVTLMHPVEQVSWLACRRILQQYNLVLPTEAQWEYAARAGTSTVWSTGDERQTLVDSVNLADRSAVRVSAPWKGIKDWPELDDGYVVHAPVGTYKPNHFGLHEMHGNVWEWCRDWYAAYDVRVREGDGERQVTQAKNRVTRGGGFVNAAHDARSAKRNNVASTLTSADLGVRPVYVLRGGG